MIRAITAARMRMTVVVLFGEKIKDNITMQTVSFTPDACVHRQQEGG